MLHGADDGTRTAGSHALGQVGLRLTHLFGVLASEKTSKKLFDNRCFDVLEKLRYTATAAAIDRSN